jgi:hypothetical protein
LNDQETSPKRATPLRDTEVNEHGTSRAVERMYEIAGMNVEMENVVRVKILERIEKLEHGIQKAARIGLAAGVGWTGRPSTYSRV